MVTVGDIEAHRQAARKAFDIHANAMGKLIQGNRSLDIDMCRWMSMNVSVFDDVALALAMGAADPDKTLQGRVEHAVKALRDSAPDLALAFETALTAGLRAAILLRLGRVDGATENGRRALRALLDELTSTLVPRIVDLGMASRARRGRFSRIAAAIRSVFSRLAGSKAGALPFFGVRDGALSPRRAAHTQSPHELLGEEEVVTIPKLVRENTIVSISDEPLSRDG
jgi:hypothetical protein